MPESVQSPGTFWALPDSPDREALLEQSRLLALWAYTGRVTFLDGSRSTLEVFVPRDLDIVDIEDRMYVVCEEIGIRHGFLRPNIEP